MERKAKNEEQLIVPFFFSPVLLWPFFFVGVCDDQEGGHLQSRPATRPPEPANKSTNLPIWRRTLKKRSRKGKNKNKYQSEATDEPLEGIANRITGSSGDPLIARQN